MRKTESLFCVFLLSINLAINTAESLSSKEETDSSCSGTECMGKRGFSDEAKEDNNRHLYFADEDHKSKGVDETLGNGVGVLNAPPLRPSLLRRKCNKVDGKKKAGCEDREQNHEPQDFPRGDSFPFVPVRFRGLIVHHKHPDVAQQSEDEYEQSNERMCIGSQCLGRKEVMKSYPHVGKRMMRSSREKEDENTRARSINRKYREGEFQPRGDVRPPRRPRGDFRGGDF